MTINLNKKKEDKKSILQNCHHCQKVLPKRLLGKEIYFDPHPFFVQKVFKHLQEQ